MVAKPMIEFVRVGGYYSTKPIFHLIYHRKAGWQGQINNLCAWQSKPRMYV